MQKLQSIQSGLSRDQNIMLDTRHMLMSVWCNVWVIRPSIRPWIEKPSTWKSFVSPSWSILLYNSSQSEVVWGLERQIKIGLCFQSEIRVKSLPSEWKFTVEWKFADRMNLLLSKWKYSHPSENMIIRVKLSSRWKYSEWKDYHRDENLPIE